MSQYLCFTENNDKNMNTKKNFFFTGFAFLWLFFTAFTLYPEDISTSLKEIEELFQHGKYSIVLEKSLNLLNTKEDRLTPAEAAFLHYYIGLAYKKDRNLDMAVDYFKKIPLKFPNSDFVKSAYLELADIYKNDYFQEETNLVKVFESFPRTPEAVQAGIKLAKGYLDLKNYKKALSVLEILVTAWKKGDENPGSYLLMALGYSGIDEYLRAVEYLRRAEKAIPSTLESNPSYLFEAGKIFYNNLAFREATVYLEKLFNIYPDYKDFPDAAILLAHCYEREGKLLLGAVFLIKAIDKTPPQKYLCSLYLDLGRLLGKLEEKDLKTIKHSYPRFSNAKALLTEVKNNALDFEQRRTAAILLGDEFKKSEKMDQVIDNFYSFLGERRDPVVEKLFKENLESYLYDLEKKGDFQGIFNTWVKIKNRKSYLSPEILLRFGEILFQAKLYANAEEVYHHITKYRMYSTSWPPALKQLIRIYFQLGQYENCLRQYRQLLLDPEANNDEFTYYRLFCLRSLGRESEFDKLLDSVAPSFTPITDVYRFRIAQLKAEQLGKAKKYDEALAIYQQMIPFDRAPAEDQGSLMISLANLYYSLKDLESSLRYYRLAEKFDTNPEWVLFRTAIVLQELGKTPDALIELDKLKKINPNSFWVRQLEKNIR